MSGYTSKVFIQSQAAWQLLDTLDEKLIGTNDYLGRAYFWNHGFKHYLRDATPKIRVRVHNEFMKHGLSLFGYTVEHMQIIERIFKTNLSAYYNEAISDDEVNLYDIKGV